VRPRPALLLLVTFGAGLATGLSRFWDPLCVALGLLLAAWWLRRGLAGFGAAAALLGLASGTLALRLEQRRCAAMLPAGPVALEVRLSDPVLPDTRLGRIELQRAGCSGDINARWPAGVTVAAGTVSRIQGRWLPRRERFARPAGLLLVTGFEAVSADPDAVTRLRTWLGGTVRRLFGTRAGTVDALVLNRRGAMTAALRDRYARAGLVHILSISGFHVGVIVGWMVLLGRAAGLDRVRAAVAAAGVAASYVLFLDWPPPAARAAILAGLVAQFQLRQRNVEPLALLSTTCLLVLLLDPWAVLDPGAWLSATALAGALHATRWSDRALGPTWFWRTLAGSIGATLATAPITAALFGTVSLAGVGLNFLAIPLAAVAVPGILLSLVAAGLVPALASPLAAASGALLGLLDQVAWWGGRWEGAAVTVPAEPRAALPWLGLLLVVGWCLTGRAGRWEALRRALLCAAATSWAFLAVEGSRGADVDQGLALHFLDVGQGDAAVLHTPGGHWVLLDAGPRGEGSDAGRRVVVPFLQRHRASALAVVLLSHAHADHLGGLPAVMDRYPAGEVLEPADLVADPLYGEWLAELETRDVPWQAARAGQSFELDSVHFTVLHPDTVWPGWQEDLNEDSIVLLLEYHGFLALLQGDAGLPAESWLAGRIGRVDLLKVGHHGSRSATGAAWLEELAPRIAVISTGRGNRYGHPHREVVERLLGHGVSLWRTDLDGTVTVSVAGDTVTVRGQARQERFVAGIRMP
jgi:competence protein ComEC